MVSRFISKLHQSYSEAEESLETGPNLYGDPIKRIVINGAIHNVPQTRMEKHIPELIQEEELFCRIA